MNRLQKGFSGIELLIAMALILGMLGLFYGGHQASVPFQALASGEQARQWALMAEVLRRAHGQVRSGGANRFRDSFIKPPGAVLSPFKTAYMIRLPAQGVAEVSVLMPAARGGWQRHSYYAEPQPHSRATLDKILLYKQTVF